MQSFVADDGFQTLIEDHRERERWKEHAHRHRERADPSADHEADEGAKDHEGGGNDAGEGDPVEKLSVTDLSATHRVSPDVRYRRISAPERQQTRLQAGPKHRQRAGRGDNVNVPRGKMSPLEMQTEREDQGRDGDDSGQAMAACLHKA